MQRSHSLVVAAALVLVGAGCISVHRDPAGEPRVDNVSIERGKAEMVRLEVKITAGELRISGGAEKLLEAEFRYNVPLMKPQVRYDSTGFRGHLLVEQAASREIHVGGDVENRWNLRVNDDTPLDVLMRMGAGEGRLNLGSLDLRRVEIHMGVGEVEVDLRGHPKRDYDVEIRGGVGEATVRLPSDVGVIAEAKGGIGEISVNNLRKEGNRYVNDAYGKTKPTIRLDVRGGVGQINLIG